MRHIYQVIKVLLISGKITFSFFKFQWISETGTSIMNKKEHEVPNNYTTFSCQNLPEHTDFRILEHTNFRFARIYQ